MKKMTEDLQRLVCLHFKMTQRIAKRWYAANPRLRDIIESAAIDGLVDGVCSFNSIFSKSIASWVSYKVHLGIRKEIRKHNKWVAFHREKENIEQVDSCTYEGNMLDEFFEFLPKPHRELCVLVYQLGFSLVEASEKMKISKSRATKIHNDALRILRRFFTDG